MAYCKINVKLTRQFLRLAANEDGFGPSMKRFAETLDRQKYRIVRTTEELDATLLRIGNVCDPAGLSDQTDWYTGKLMAFFIPWFFWTQDRVIEFTPFGSQEEWGY